MDQNTPQIDLLAAALVAAQGELEAAAFDSTNPFLKNRYASLGSIIAKSRPVLAKNGLAIIQKLSTSEGHASVQTTILHKSGQCFDGGTITFPVGEEKGKSLAQVTGSLFTYGKRYAWSSVLGIYADEDTDGNAPPKQTAIPRQQAPVKPATPPPVKEEPKATAKFRLQALNKLQAAPGGRNRQLFMDYALSKQWLRGDQQPEDWSLDHVPATAEQFSKLVEDLHNFEMARNEVPTP